MELSIRHCTNDLRRARRRKEPLRWVQPRQPQLFPQNFAGRMTETPHLYGLSSSSCFELDYHSLCPQSRCCCSHLRSAREYRQLSPSISFQIGHGLHRRP